MNRQIHWYLLPVSFQCLLKCVLAIVPTLPSVLCMNTRAVFINAGWAGYCVAPALQWFSCDSLTGPWVPTAIFLMSSYTICSAFCRLLFSVPRHLSHWGHLLWKRVCHPNPSPPPAACWTLPSSSSCSDFVASWAQPWPRQLNWKPLTTPSPSSRNPHKLLFSFLL